ncbi:ribonuclease H [Mycobacterium sp. TNTM28]|uniref:Ribonuclease H n=1 Tax=[Mycobacterium] fortunisiensis TaxID=2600579 RepID=A0ABS6KIW7_9MYCO|nr:RNase H family protein [[Mycobacterium] fortunisiensis]MBU9763547.1 ribonuclease H [[Mycobacterium] fortunisiensis]
MTVVPQARPPRGDLVYAKPRPAVTVAIAVAETDRGYHYVAFTQLWSCSAVTAAPNAEVAVLDAIDAVRARFRGPARFRFVVNVTSGSPLWRYAGQISEAAQHWWIERPDHKDRSLVEAAAAHVAALTDTAPPTSPPAPELGPIIVATDGSVRRKYAGFGWLASSGEYGLAGYRTSSKRVGAQKVLVAELRAIHAAVCGLPGHHVVVLSDSKPAVAMVDRWKCGTAVMPAGYPVEESGGEHCLNAARRRIYLERDRIEVRWVPGHRGEPLNEGADALARLGSRYRRGDLDLDDSEYHRRAAGIAQSFAAEFRRSGT